MTTAVPIATGVGDLLRDWRRRRRLSQLDVSLDAAVSARHLSFVETGRSKPSRELVRHLAEFLDVPLHERNALLLAAGYAPVHGETPLAPPANALRVCLHPDGLAPRIANLREYGAHLITRLQRQLAVAPDPDVAALLEELRGYPGAAAPADVAAEPAELLFAPLRLRALGHELRLFSTLATFGTALDVTVAELAIESFFPADDATEAALREAFA